MQLEQLAALSLVLAVVAATGDADVDVRSALKLPTLFHFQEYERLFEKSYSGLVENLNRSMLFMARALRVFISTTKFKYRWKTFYLAINYLSDRTPHELDKMRNRVLARQIRSPSATAEIRFGDKKTSGTMMAGDEQSIGNDFKEELEPLGEKKAHEQLEQEPKTPSTNANARGKREVVHMPNQLIAESLAEVTNSLLFEPPLFGMVEQQEHVPYEVLGPTADALDDFQVRLERIKHSLSTFKSIEHDDQEDEGRPNEVFSDLRKTNCLFLPRDQGTCRGGYAFAAISLMEYQYCMKTGKLAAFSEQYIIDCGKAYFGNYVSGCHGGLSNSMPEFFHNFGLELRALYPYRAREDDCPYPPDTDLKTAGYLRPDVKSTVDIHISRWPQVLKYQPLLAEITGVDDFYEYGGGVLGWDCSQDNPQHVMLVVGHGRENGHEYWLVRNSWGFGWGEAGHMKLDKRANCVYLYRGITFGTNTGQEMLMEVAQNARYDASKVKRHYFDRMRDRPLPVSGRDFVDLS